MPGAFSGAVAVSTLVDDRSRHLSSRYGEQAWLLEEHMSSGARRSERLSHALPFCIRRLRAIGAIQDVFPSSAPSSR